MALQLISPNVNLDFVGKRKFFVGLSVLINLASIILLFTVGLNYGVDFSGGSVCKSGSLNRPIATRSVKR